MSPKKAQLRIKEFNEFMRENDLFYRFQGLYSEYVPLTYSPKKFKKYLTERVEELKAELKVRIIFLKEMLTLISS